MNCGQKRGYILRNVDFCFRGDKHFNQCLCGCGEKPAGLLRGRRSMTAPAAPGAWRCDALRREQGQRGFARGIGGDLVFQTRFQLRAADAGQ